LAASFNDFLEYAALLVQHHRTLFPTDNPEARRKLEFLLRCLARLSDMRVYAHAHAKDVRAEVAAALRRGTADKYDGDLDGVLLPTFFPPGSFPNSTRPKPRPRWPPAACATRCRTSRTR